LFALSVTECSFALLTPWCKLVHSPASLRARSYAAAVRILLALLVVAVLVYVIVRLVERRLGGPGTSDPQVHREPDPWAEAAYQRSVRERAERQRTGAPEPEPEVLIDGDVFGFDEPSAEYFVVVSPAPERAVADAVRRANQRFMLVDENGVEHADWDALDAASDALGPDDDLYTPNYAAEPTITAAGVEGYVDCKGGIELAMGVTMRRVLREELAALRAPARVQVRDTV
jgi:hypothetical protein